MDLRKIQYSQTDFKLCRNEFSINKSLTGFTISEFRDDFVRRGLGVVAQDVRMIVIHQYWIICAIVTTFVMIQSNQITTAAQIFSSFARESRIRIRRKIIPKVMCVLEGLMATIWNNLISKNLLNFENFMGVQFCISAIIKP